MFDKIAEALKNARIQSGLTLLQVAAKTRIDIKFIELMENGNFSFLPDLYVRAFLKDYSGIVGLDVDLMLKKYEAAKLGKYYNENENLQETAKKEIKKLGEEPKSILVQPRQDKPPEKPQQPISYDAVSRNVVPEESAAVKNKKNMVYTSIALGAISFIVLIIILLTRGDSEIIIPEKPIEEAIEQNKQRYLEGPKKNDTNSQIKTTDSLSLFIEANDTSWVKIIIDNKTEEEFILFPKSQKEIAAANNYKIIFGNSGAIELQLNNKPLNFTGTKKEIRYIQIDSSGIQYLNSPPVLE